jgi:OmpA family
MLLIRFRSFVWYLTSKAFSILTKWELRIEARPIVELIADVIRVDGPQAYTLVVGHTDAIGTDDVNDQIANGRATNVLQRLVSLGISAKHLHTAAMGRRQPIAPNWTPEGRARNRRVEFFIAQSFQANLDALAQIPVESKYLEVGGGAEPQPPPPSEDVPIQDATGKRSGGVTIRPPGQHRLRDF